MDFTFSVPQPPNYSGGKAQPRPATRLNRNAKPYAPPTSHHKHVSDREENHPPSSIPQYGGFSGNVDHSLTEAIAYHQNLVEIIPGGPQVAQDQQAQFEAFVKEFPGKRKALEAALSRPANHNPIQDQRTNRWSPFPVDQESLEAVRTFLLYDDHLRKRDVEMRAFSRPLRQYILSATEMVQNDFLVPSYMESEVGDVGNLGPFAMPPVWDEKWVEVGQAKELATLNVKRVFAIDCEMVLAGDEQILAQVCLVDWFSERIVYFQYVAPPPHKVITDYVTEKSGITPATLCGVTKTLEQVQRDLLRLIQQSNTILVGHGLHTDLKVLKFSHSTVVDTSLIFDPPYGRKPGPPTLWQRPKLRDLVNVLLGEEDFQNGSHSPASDALACIKLTKAKLSHGPRFGGYGFRIFKLELKNQGYLPGHSRPLEPAGRVGTPVAVWQPPTRLPSASLFSFAPTTSKPIEIKAQLASGPMENYPQGVVAMLNSSSMGVNDTEEDMVMSDSDLDVRESCRPPGIPDEDEGVDTEPEDENTLSIPSHASYRPCPTPASASFLGMFSPSAMSFTI